MLPGDVAKQWDVIRPALEITMSGDDTRSDMCMNNILQSLIGGTMHCWLLKDRDDSVKIISTTTFFYDPAGKKYLFIYSIFGYSIVSLEQWKELFESWSRWAARNSCSGMMAYTDNSRLIRLVKHFGGSTNLSVVNLDINFNGRKS